MYTVYVSGGHVSFLEDDGGFGTDPTGENKAALRDQMLYLKNFAYTFRFWVMTPSNSLVASGSAYAMASSTEMAAYFYNGGTATLNLTKLKGKLSARWYNPLDGKFGEAFKVQGGGQVEFKAPDDRDWALLVKRS